MKPDPDRLKELFAQALQKQSAAEREGYLAEACKDDPELRLQLDSLLRARLPARVWAGPPAW